MRRKKLYEEVSEADHRRAADVFEYEERKKKKRKRNAGKRWYIFYELT
jgi:hypothetical protein